MKERRYKICIFAIVALWLATVVFFMPVNRCPETSFDESIFAEINHSSYPCENGGTTVEYLVYEKETHVVYVYIVNHNSVSISPYIMRDLFGQMTVGIYDTYADVIMPAEIYFDDGETWFVTV